MDTVERNRRALERATAEGITIELRGGELTVSGHTTLVEAFACKPDGTKYQCWATAGSYLDSEPGYLVAFSCQCPAGQHADGPSRGVTACKHEAALAARLVGVKLAEPDREGRYRTTPLAGKPGDHLGHLISLPSLLLREEEAQS